MEETQEKLHLNVEEIMEILPHRYPMLLVDKITEMVPMDYVIGQKSVTMNEPFFQGHFPGRPIMPGALICEAMAQVGGVALQYPEETEDSSPCSQAWNASTSVPRSYRETFSSPKLSLKRSRAAWAKSTAKAP